MFLLRWILKVLQILGGPRGREGGIIRSEKWENHKNSTHNKIKFYIIFIYTFFLIFAYRGGQGGGKGRAGGVIRSENWENHKNSTHTKIEFPIIFT